MAGWLSVVVVGRAGSGAAELATVVAAMVEVTVVRLVVLFGAGAAIGTFGALLLAIRVAETVTHEMRVAREFEHRQWRAFVRRQVRGGRSMTGADQIGVN